VVTTTTTTVPPSTTPPTSTATPTPTTTPTPPRHVDAGSGGGASRGFGSPLLPIGAVLVLGGLAMAAWRIVRRPG
jgi:hypothetical protein